MADEVEAPAWGWWEPRSASPCAWSSAKEDFAAVKESLSSSSALLDIAVPGREQPVVRMDRVGDVETVEVVWLRPRVARRRLGAMFAEFVFEGSVASLTSGDSESGASAGL